MGDFKEAQVRQTLSDVSGQFLQVIAKPVRIIWPAC